MLRLAVLHGISLCPCRLFVFISSVLVHFLQKAPDSWVPWTLMIYIHNCVTVFNCSDMAVVFSEDYSIVFTFNYFRLCGVHSLMEQSLYLSFPSNWVQGIFFFFFFSSWFCFSLQSTHRSTYALARNYWNRRHGHKHALGLNAVQSCCFQISSLLCKLSDRHGV